jgi:RNA polymerase sigma factor (TIGR02999 family)
MGPDFPESGSASKLVRTLCTLRDYLISRRVGEYTSDLRKGASRGTMPEVPSAQLTELLQNWKQGDEKALRALVPLVYKELRRLAHYHLQSERPDHTLQSTALVHEVYLRLLGGRPADLRNRGHFIAVASGLMRRILVDYARERRASKRDGGCRIAVEDLEALLVNGDDAELVALDDALDELSRIDKRQAKIVEMKFFGGLSAPEISEVLGLSRATVDRDWATARVWLYRQMQRTE